MGADPGSISRCYNFAVGMNVLTLATLIAFWARHPDAERACRAWLKRVRQREYRDFGAVKADFPSADWVQGHIVFDIGGNKYRLIVKPNFAGKRFRIVFIGTHREYDTWRPQ